MYIVYTLNLYIDLDVTVFIFIRVFIFLQPFDVCPLGILSRKRML